MVKPIGEQLLTRLGQTALLRTVQGLLADLRGATLSAANFTGADLAHASFTDTFGTAEAIAMSPDGHLLAAGTNEGEIRLWRLQDGQLQTIMSGDCGHVWSIAFSPDGQALASGYINHQVRVWDVRTGQLHQVLEGHGDVVWSVACSPDGQTLASASDDQTIRLWKSWPLPTQSASPRLRGAALKVLGAVEEALKALRDEDGYVTSGDYWRRLS